MKMSLFNRVHNVANRELTRYLWIAGIIFAASALLFFGYYIIDRYVRVGNKSMIDTGIQRLEQAVRDNPQDPGTRVALAEYYMGKSLYAKSIDQVSQVLESFPDNEGALLIAGTAYSHLGRAQEAITSFEALVKIRGGSKSADHTTLQTAYFFLGKNYNALGQHDKALVALEYALKFTPTDADALYEAGIAAQATKQFEKAVGFYSKAARLVPDFGDVYSGLIDSYTSLNQPEYVAYARGMQALTLGDYKTAQTHLEYATKAIQNFAPAYYGLALAYEKLNRLNDAYNVINIAAQLDPKNISIQQVQGRLKSTLKVQG